MWHWFTVLAHPPTSIIGVDGHPESGPLFPPIVHRRRMFAGGRLRRTADIPFGSDLRSRTHVADVVVKNGRQGELAFVTTRTELSVGTTVVQVEEQDIMYRSEPPGPVRPVPRPMKADTAADTAADAGWRRDVRIDPVLLARFSGLTYNGHRIHYDRSYATEVEGYPDLVVHGPLLVLIALELPRVHASSRWLAEFTYRLVRPTFLPATVVATGDLDGGTVTISGGADGAAASVVATAQLI